jgi:hypothetical protein
MVISITAALESSDMRSSESFQSTLKHAASRSTGRVRFRSALVHGEHEAARARVQRFLNGDRELEALLDWPPLPAGREVWAARIIELLELGVRDGEVTRRAVDAICALGFPWAMHVDPDWV